MAVRVMGVVGSNFGVIKDGIGVGKAGLFRFLRTIFSKIDLVMRGKIK